MRRADRLFQIVQFLRRRRRAVTAQVIAEHFGVCQRTIYRDLQALMASGVPINGEAGVGYLFDRHYDLPPVMFDSQELEALALGAAMVKNWTDDAFAARANSALDKIAAVLPESMQNELQKGVLFSQPSASKPVSQVSFSMLRDCIRQQQRLHFRYEDEKGRSSVRQVRPLAMVYFGPVWLLLAWCEKRRDFRSFRLDRITGLKVLETGFQPEAGKTLQDYIERMERCEVS